MWQLTSQLWLIEHQGNKYSVELKLIALRANQLLVLSETTAMTVHVFMNNL